MVHISNYQRNAHPSSLYRLIVLVLAIGLLFRGVESNRFPQFQRSPLRPGFGPRIGVPKRDLEDSDDWGGKIPLVITNECDTTIWPGVATQHGQGPGTGGFELAMGKSRRLWVGSDWQGRVWGRTNCTVNGDSCSCKTGDCLGKLDCEFSGETPATLVEFNLAGGVDNMQTFYDISLVDGYNLPMGLKFIPSKNTSDIPPNLTNCACIATPGWLYTETDTGTWNTNSTYPIPLETTINNQRASRWCPWRLLAFPPTKPGDGIYPYPDDMIQRPEFSPCNSACAASGSDKDCCVGKYHDPDICRPSDYSWAAKRICPDAYSYAFDDQKSTFIIPKGGGWEVTICPKGRSTNILRQLGNEMFELGSSGKLSDLAMRRLKNVTYIEADKSVALGLRPAVAVLVSATGVVGTWLFL